MSDFSNGKSATADIPPEPRLSRRRGNQTTMTSSNAAKLARPLLLGVMVSALGLAAAPAAQAGKPLIDLGPKTAKAADPIEFTAGDDLSKAGPGLIWQNEKDGVKGLKQVVIASFQVEFVMNASAASTGSSLQQAKVSYTLSGPSQEDMQAITDAYYARFVEGLAATGVTVIPLQDAIGRSPGLQRLMNMAKPAPYIRGGANRSGFYSPPGYKFYFTPLDGRARGMGDTMTTTGSQVPEEMAMKELDAGILGVRMVVDFAEIEARGRGVLGMRPPTAKVKSKANVALLPVDTQLWVLTPQAKSTYMDLGHRQRYALTSPIVMPDSILSASDTTTAGSKLSDGVASAIGVLGGFGGQKTRTYQVTVDPAVWSKDVSAAMDEVGKAMIARFNADR